MFEVRTRWGRILLQVVVTLLVLPFLFPLVAMVQGSLAGDGWGTMRRSSPSRPRGASSSTPWSSRPG